MLGYYMYYYYKEPGFYVLRLVLLLVMASIESTVFLDLQPTTDNTVMYLGAMFITVISVMLAAVASISLVAKDRREAVGRVDNGIFTPATYVGSQLVASALYNFAVTVVFVSIVHWVEHLNPNRECYMYNIAINWGHLMLMEAVLCACVEVLKNDFLCTAFSMIFMGTTMLFSGFFRVISNTPNWISWVMYMLPLKVTNLD